MKVGTQTPPVGPWVCGIDLSSRWIDIVRLDENTDEATWTSINLTGHDAWARTRAIRPSMPPATFWADVYICAIEKPFGPSRLAQSVLMRAQGAILAAIPDPVEVWEVTPDQWRHHLGIPRTVKPAWRSFPASLRDDSWSQDARDALAIALYARDVNAKGVAAALASTA